MPAELLLPTARATDANANPYSGARWIFYATGGTTPQTVYADADLTTSLGHIVTADSGGKFVPIYMNAALAYRGICENASGSTILHDIDPINNDALRVILGDLGTVQDTLDEQGAKLGHIILATDYGAVGDCNGNTGNGTDNTTAIQAGLDYLGTVGGGVLTLPPSTGGYRITSGLKMPTNVVIEGPWGKGYPYSIAGSLIADFSNVNQWAIEPKTTVGGLAVAYNVMIVAVPTWTTNCGLRNLTLRVATGGNIPYGAVRFHGCPGSFTEGLSIVDFGHGLLVNYTTGGSYEVHAETLYTGVVNWDEANGNVFNVYAAQASPYPTTVPAGYLLPFMSSLSAILTTTYHLTTNAHYNRPQGIICGSLASSSNSVVFDAVVERFTGGIFLLNANSIGFRQCYLEKHAGGMSSAIVAAQVTFSIHDLYANLSASGNLLDIGAGGNGDVRANGSMSVSSFGTVYLSATARMLIRSITIDQFGPTTTQFNIHYETAGLWRVPTLVNSWANIVGDLDAGYRREMGRVFLNGAVNGGSSSTTITTLPVGYRPYALVRFPGGTVSSAGVVTATTTGPVSLTGVSFEAIG